MMISLGLPSTCSFFLAERSGFASLPQPATGLAASANTLRAPSRSGHPSGSDPPEVPAESDVRRRPASDKERRVGGDRKSTRLNSSHLVISYAVFCLKKKKKKQKLITYQNNSNSIVGT